MKNTLTFALSALVLMSFVSGYYSGSQSSKIRQRNARHQRIETLTLYGKHKHTGTTPQRIADKTANVIGDIALLFSN